MFIRSSRLNICFDRVRTLDDLELLLFKETHVRTVVRLDPRLEIMSVSKLARVFNDEYMDDKMTVAKWRTIIERALNDNIGVRGQTIINNISKRYITVFAPNAASANGNTLIKNVRETATVSSN